MTTHTGHNHPATPAARKRCRENRRNAIRTCQLMYVDTQDNGTGFAEYQATVDNFAFQLGIPVAEMFDLVERGPVIN